MYAIGIPKDRVWDGLGLARCLVVEGGNGRWMMVCGSFCFVVSTSQHGRCVYCRAATEVSSCVCCVCTRAMIWFNAAYAWHTSLIIAQSASLVERLAVVVQLFTIRRCRLAVKVKRNRNLGERCEQTQHENGTSIHPENKNKISKNRQRQIRLLVGSQLKQKLVVCWKATHTQTQLPKRRTQNKKKIASV